MEAQVTIPLVLSISNLAGLFVLVFALGRYAEKISELTKKIKDCEENHDELIILRERVDQLRAPKIVS